jgi:diguanylate cyclase (GGDEF)-like protein/PAS domain S-box-containing protein
MTPALAAAVAVVQGSRRPYIAKAPRWHALAGALLFAACAAVRAEVVPPSEITVVTDFNYPPYLFTAGGDELQGIIKDKWDLWSRKTGVRARVIGVSWVKAQEGVLDGTYDVIETLSYTEARTKLYEYSPPYAPVAANVYFHRSISGIGDIASLRGFTIGAKQGSACGNWLTERGIGAIRVYETSELLVRAAGSGELGLFCMDAMTAQYYLFKLDLADEFRASPPLYATNFHWAVKKGRDALRDFIQRGFEQFMPSELEHINARWLGNPLRFPIATRYLYYAALLVAVMLAAYAVLIVWNRGLRARVSAKTAELENALLSLDQAVSAGSIGLFDWDIANDRVRYSREWKRQIGYAEHEVSDRVDEWRRRVHPDDIERVRAGVRELMETRKGEYRTEFRFRHRDGSYRWMLAQSTLLLDAHGRPLRMVGSHVDITDNKRNEALLAGQKQVLEMVASGVPLAQSLETLLRVIEDQSSEMICSILLLDADGRHVRHGAAPSLPAEFVRAIDGEPIGESAGSCGTAAYRREPVVVEDIATDPLWARYRDFTLQFGLRACWSTPIFDAEHRVLGTFAIYFRTPRRPTALHQRYIDIVTYTAAIAIVKQREQQALKEHEEQLRQALRERTRLAHDLGERFKELTLLHRVARLLEGTRPVDQPLLTELVTMVPAAWQFPEICEARIAHATLTAATPGWRETPWMQQAHFTADDASSGTIEVAYLEERPVEAEGPFLAEERSLIDSLADMLSAYVKRGRAEAALRDSEERLRLAVTGARLGTWHWDIANDVLTGSAETLALLGFPADARIPRGEFLALLHARDRALADAALRRAFKERAPYEFEFRVVHAERWIAARGQAYFDALGRAVRMEGIAFDITERKLAEDKIKRLNRVYAMLSGINAVIVRERDWQELLREACRLAAVTGKFRSAWIGLVDEGGARIRTVGSQGIEHEFIERLDVAMGEDAVAGQGMIWRAVRAAQPLVANDLARETQTVPLHESLRERGIQALAALPLIVAGEVAGVLVLGASEADTFDAEEMSLLGELASDVAFGLDHIRKEERLNYLAYYDALTGLANQTLFQERLTQRVHAAQRDGRHIALCLLDIDHFKNVNDALGRHVGDALLLQFAERLARCVADSTLVARLSADRFALLLPEAQDETEVLDAIEKKSAQCIGQPFRLGDTELRVAVKVGIALSPAEGARADTLFRNAEAALKRAKLTGERHLFYTEQMTERVGERLALESRLRRALERDEFVLYYQPKVDARTRFVTGVEALIRWHDPEAGLVLPGTFIPLLESTGMIRDVGNWAIRRAVADHAQWLALGLDAPRVAVNVSSLQLRQRDFVDNVRASLAPAPGALDLEITESLIMTDIEANIGKLRALSELGVRIAIDDFGTGYSSLGYLATLPVQVLKIDLSFIARMLNDPGAMTLVTTMISLAHSLGLKVVAEGVETDEQAQALLGLGCDELQGYLIDRPLPPDRLVEFLRRSAVSAAAVGGVDGRVSGGIKH